MLLAASMAIKVLFAEEGTFASLALELYWVCQTNVTTGLEVLLVVFLAGICFLAGLAKVTLGISAPGGLSDPVTDCSLDGLGEGLVDRLELSLCRKSTVGFLLVPLKSPRSF